MQGRGARGPALSDRAIPPSPPRSAASPASPARRRSPGPLKIRVLPDGLLLDDRPPARADSALSRAGHAAAQPSHRRAHDPSGGDVEAWRTFLLLLGRTPESVRSDGGIARVWTTMAGRHVGAARDRLRRSAARARRRRSGGVEARDRQLPAGQLVSISTRRASASCSASPATASSSPT